MDSLRAQVRETGVELDAAFAEIRITRVPQRQHRITDTRQRRSLPAHHPAVEIHRRIRRLAVPVSGGDHQQVLLPGQTGAVVRRHVMDFRLEISLLEKFQKFLRQPFGISRLGSVKHRYRNRRSRRSGTPARPGQQCGKKLAKPYTLLLGERSVIGNLNRGSHRL